jgi:hypothetical protein
LPRSTSTRAGCVRVRARLHALTRAFDERGALVLSPRRHPTPPPLPPLSFSFLLPRRRASGWSDTPPMPLSRCRWGSLTRTAARPIV